MSPHHKPGFPPLPQSSSPEDTQPVERPSIPGAPQPGIQVPFVTGGFAPVHHTGPHHISNLAPPLADDAPTLPPEQMSQIHAPSPSHDPFMTGRLDAITQKPPNQHLLASFQEEPDRVSYGIWGAAVGCIVGIVFGVLNALFEGVYPADNQGPLIIFTLLGLLTGGAVSAAAPRRVSQLIKDLFYFYR